MANFTNQPKSSSSFANEPRTAAGVYGDQSNQVEEDLTFQDLAPNVTPLAQIQDTAFNTPIYANWINEPKD